MNYNIATERILHSTPTRMALKDGTKSNNEVINSVAKELREYLTQYKGQHIGKEELETFYRRYFPKARLNIIDGRSTDSIPGKTIAESNVSYTDDMKDVQDFQIFIRSKSPMDVLKWLFALPNDKKAFYVNNRFIKIYIHEYIHFMQRYLKPIDKAVNSSMLSHSYGSMENFSAICNGIKNADRNIVYISEKGKNFSAERFREQLMTQLKAPKYSSDMLVKDELKFLIRHAQSEQQAYQIEMEEGAWLKRPKLMQNKYYRAYIRMRNKKLLGQTFRFDEKIRIMKEEYFKIIQQEREKIQTYTEIINS